MLRIDVITPIIMSIMFLIIIACIIGIIIASRFQKKQDKKYKECLNIIKEKGNATMQVKNGLTNDEINSIDSKIDVNILMSELYDTFLRLIDKEKNLDNNFDGILTGVIKEFYESKIDSYKASNRSEVTDGIELIGYSITEFDKNSLNFRININCFNYKMNKNMIVSGSNLDKVEQILIINYKNVDDKWLINKIEKAYENKINR